MNDELMWRSQKSMKMQQTMALESMAVSLMAMVLIFGLGFIFPSINPYIVVKWIVYVTAVYFIWAIPGNWIRRMHLMRMWKKGMKKSEDTEVKSVKKVSRRK